jgi:hypothetical protein
LKQVLREQVMLMRLARMGLRKSSGAEIEAEPESKTAEE